MSVANHNVPRSCLLLYGELELSARRAVDGALAFFVCSHQISACGRRAGYDNRKKAIEGPGQQPQRESSQSYMGMAHNKAEKLKEETRRKIETDEGICTSRTLNRYEE